MIKGRFDLKQGQVWRCKWGGHAFIWMVEGARVRSDYRQDITDSRSYASWETVEEFSQSIVELVREREEAVKVTPGDLLELIYCYYGEASDDDE